MGRIDCGVKGNNNNNSNNISIFKQRQDNMRPVSPEISRRFW